MMEKSIMTVSMCYCCLILKFTQQCGVSRDISARSVSGSMQHHTEYDELRELVTHATARLSLNLIKLVWFLWL